VSPRYKVLNDTFQGSMGPVAMRILMQPAHWNQRERHRRILKETMTRFENWYGPYPYKTITLVDPEYDSEADGMEYPTFITGGTNWWMPKGIYWPESTVEHEFGHQYWYGMVATNEFEDAWLDEGINQYSEAKVMDSIYGPRTSVMNMFGITGGERGSDRIDYLGVADLDPIARNGWGYANASSYGGITYSKTALTLLTLESIIGEDTLRRAMHTYFMRYRFTHPTKEDFLKTIEEVSGQNLRWYFDQAVYGTEVLDYEVMSLDSDPVDWYRPEKQQQAAEEAGSEVYRSYALVHRKGDFVFPVELEVRFDNGEKVREHWDGRDRWVRYEYDKKARIASVELDPDHKVLLDRDFFNNSKRAEPNPKPAWKLTNYFTFVTQWFTQFLAWWLT
jgi:aminopeptidase N